MTLRPGEAEAFEAEAFEAEAFEAGVFEAGAFPVGEGLTAAAGAVSEAWRFEGWIARGGVLTNKLRRRAAVFAVLLCLSGCAPRGGELPVQAPPAGREERQPEKQAAGERPPETEVLNRLVWQVIEEGRSREWEETLEAFGDETPALQASGEAAAAAKLCEILSEVSWGGCPLCKGAEEGRGGPERAAGRSALAGSVPAAFKGCPCGCAGV